MRIAAIGLNLQGKRTNRSMVNTNLNHVNNTTTDTFVSSNIKPSFKGAVGLYEYLSEKNPYFSHYASKEIFEILDSIPSTGTPYLGVKEWKNAPSENGKNLKIGLDENNRHVATMEYVPYDDLYSPGYMPKKIIAFNHKNKRVAKELEMGTSYFMHTTVPSVRTMTIYHNDGITPKYKIDHAGYSKAPSKTDYVSQFDDEGNIEIKYAVTTGAGNYVHIEHFNKNGKVIAEMNFMTNPAY